MADMLCIAQLHQTTGEQAQCPASLSYRTWTARQRNEMRFLLSIQGSCSRLGVRAMIERIIQSLVHETLANADHGVATHLKGLGHLLIGPAWAWSVAIDF